MHTRRTGIRARLVKVAVLMIVVALVAIVGSRLHTPAAQLACAVPAEAPVELLDRIPVTVGAPARHAQGERVGEVSQYTAVLQARLTLDGKVRSGDVQGCTGVGAFALSARQDFGDAVRTRWRTASPENDYMIKVRVEDLEPGTRYFYRLLSGPEPSSAEAGPTGTFRTLERRGVTREVRFVVVTGMNQFAFLASTIKDLAFRERSLGFPGLAAITARAPDFFVATGDSVYYDTPYVGRAETQDEMRAKWHRQFAAPRFAALFQQVATYWQKDDHDYRYEDADPYGPFEPSARLGADVFLEQVPLADPGDEQPLTYRTHRVNDLLQIWLLEGREHRDANTAPAGRDKTLWGAEQRAWLKETLLASDATFKIIISPTPMVGPDDEAKGVQGGILAPYFGGKPLGQGDDMRKMDNHTNVFGYREEGSAFFAWLADRGFLEKNLYLVCGDRHWQYHSVHPSGFEEFSVGALVDANSRLGPSPGDANSTDPEGLIIQPYSQTEASGGFLEVNVRPAEGDQPATAEFAFYDELGLLLHSVERPAVAAVEQ